MKKDQILVLYENPLFAEGLMSILRREKVSKIERSLDRMENGWKLIRALQPDTVIIEGSEPTIDASSALRELLKHGTKGLVVSVNIKRKDAVAYVGIRFAGTESNLIRAIKKGAHGSLKGLTEKEGSYENIQRENVS